ncbi:MAG: Uma2 family endonuclease [Nostoc sp. TH1S01]|nr:Uma2 family endonuclease [Nostoc sp. TH1S01]
MVVTPIKDTTSTDYSLEDWLQSPPEGTEWVNGELLEKQVTLKHSRIQGNLCFYWRNYKVTSGQGGEVYTEPPCMTNKQGCRPDVAYLTPELTQQFGEPAVLPQSFPLIAEIISPTDLAEEMIAKSQEYLQSGCEEVWLVFPENSWIIVITKNQRLVFIAGEVVRTQNVLTDFNVAVNELLG